MRLVVVSYAFPRFANLLFKTYLRRATQKAIFKKPENEPVAKSLTHLSFSNYLPRNYDLCKLMLFQMNNFHFNHISAGYLQQNLHVNVLSLWRHMPQRRFNGAKIKKDFKVRSVSVCVCVSMCTCDCVSCYYNLYISSAFRTPSNITTIIIPAWPGYSAGLAVLFSALFL